MQARLRQTYVKRACTVALCLCVIFQCLRLQVMILYGSVYELFMWVYYGASDHWVYNALNWHTDKSVAVYILLPVGYVALFSVW